MGGLPLPDLSCLQDNSLGECSLRSIVRAQTALKQADIHRGSRHKSSQSEDGAVCAGAIPAIRCPFGRFNVLANGNIGHRIEWRRLPCEWRGHSFGRSYPKANVCHAALSQVSSVSSCDRIHGLGLPIGAQHATLNYCTKIGPPRKSRVWPHDRRHGKNGGSSVTKVDRIALN